MATQNDLFSLPLPDGIDVEELINLVPCSVWQSNAILATYQALKRSHLFDEEDYLERYPDIKQAKVDPIYHYIQYGCKENRFFKVKSVQSRKKKEKNILLEQLLTKRLPYHQLLAYLLQYDVISFDIFDTAVLRMVESPQNIFEILAVETNYPDFVALRIQAESLARDRKDQKYGTREVTIDEIYEILEQYHIQQDVKQREIELEYHLSVANPYIYKIYQELLEHKKTIVFCSDMYLSQKILADILHKNGYTEYAQIFLSNELHLTTGDGSLQKYLLNVYRDNTVIHVGDNEQFDKIQSEKVGLDAIYNPDCRIAETYAYHNNLAGSVKNAILNNYLNNGLEQKDQYFTHGFVFGGVLVSGFCHFINQIALQNNSNVILFCGRDCYIVQKIYNAFFRQVNNFYVETSKFALICLNLEVYLRVFLHQFVFTYYDEKKHQKTIKELLCETGFAFLVDKLEENDLEAYLFCDQISKETLETFFVKNFAYIQEYFPNSTQAATIYFKNMIQNSQNVLIVAIGSDDTYIKCIDYFIKKNINKNINIKGVLLFCNDTVEINNKLITHQYYSYLQNTNDQINLQIDNSELMHQTLTALLNNTETELISYDLDQEKHIIFQRKTNLAKNLREIISIQNGIYEFNKIFYQYTQNLLFCLNIPASTAFSPFIKIQKDLNYLTKIYKNFTEDADFGLYTKSSVDLTPYLTNKTILFMTPKLTYTYHTQALLNMTQTVHKLGYLPVIIAAQDGILRKNFEILQYPVVLLDPNELEVSPYYPQLKQCYLCICTTSLTDQYVKVSSKMIHTICLETINSHIVQYLEDQQQYALDYRYSGGQAIKLIQIGTLEYYTGYDLLIAAYKSLPEHYASQIEIYFAGDFSKSGMSFASYLFTEIQGLNNVHFLGTPQDETETIQLLSSMDVVVAASRDASCSLLALQGAMLAKPLIVTEKACVPYLITPDNGIMVNNEDVQDLQKALIQIVKKKDQLFQMGQESRRLYETKTNLSLYTQQFNTFLEQCASQPFTSNDVVQKDNSDNQYLIISLTSCPAKIATLHLCLESLLKQDYQNKYVIVYLSKMEFPHELADLPLELQNMVEQDLIKIKFVQSDLKAHQKYFYAMQEYEDYPIITCDADIIYPSQCLTTLYHTYKHYPECIICNRANLITFNREKKLRHDEHWLKDYKFLIETPTYQLLPTNVGGILYPPNSIPKFAFNENVLHNIALNVDHIWLKCMATYNNVQIVCTYNNFIWPNDNNTSNHALYFKNIVNYIHNKLPYKFDLMEKIRRDRFQ